MLWLWREVAGNGPTGHTFLHPGPPVLTNLSLILQCLFQSLTLYKQMKKISRDCHVTVVF